MSKENYLSEKIRAPSDESVSIRAHVTRDAAGIKKLIIQRPNGDFVTDLNKDN